VALDTVSGGDVAMRAPVVLELVAHEEQDQHGAAMYREEDGDGQHLAIVRASGRPVPRLPLRHLVARRVHGSTLPWNPAALSLVRHAGSKSRQEIGLLGFELIVGQDTSVAATPTELRVFRAIGRGIRRAAIKGSLPGANLR
jgi:hypothetical protein